jgi:hypothetical protein
MDYREYQVATSPAWQQQGPTGPAWNESLGLMKDAYGAGSRLAVKCRFPQFAPSDALDGIGATLQIERLYAQNDAAYVGQMMRAWVSWQQAGTVPGMIARMQDFGLANVAVWEAWYWSDGNPGYYFTITCSLPMPWNSYPLADGTWGDGDATKKWSDGGVWASGIPVAWRQQLKATITKWKPTHTVCAAVIVNLNTGRIWGLSGGKWGDGSFWSAGGNTLFINMTV